MPELPEVEVLARYLAPLVKGKTIRSVEVRRARVIAPTGEAELKKALTGATIGGLERRGKYLLFTLRPARRGSAVRVLGHLGMTGRFYLQTAAAALPKHAAVVLGMGRHNLIYEDTRYFGRFTLAMDSIDRLGPEPLGEDFTVEYLASALGRSNQAIKVKLLDQSVSAGVGNIYASESLFRAKISPKLRANKLDHAAIIRLHRSIRETLADAIRSGGSIPLDFAGKGARDGLFYYGASRASANRDERFRVYDRKGLPCVICGAAIERIVQAARATYHCPNCQKPV